MVIPFHSRMHLTMTRNINDFHENEELLRNAVAADERGLG
jgi:hypothetical protein